MTAVLDAPAEAPSGEVDAPPLAAWPARAGAFAVDVVLGAAVLATLALGWWTAPVRGWLSWVFAGVAAAVLVAVLVNRWLLPTITGFTLGRALFGIAVVRRDGAPVGWWRPMVRDFAHVLDTAALFLGWLWPLVDRRHRTFADLLLRTEVRTVERPRRDMRRAVALVLIGATLVSAAAVGASYVVVYRQERAVDEARAQIAEQGPRIVEQLLSYTVDSIQQDFSRAQSLTTDGYRSQLVEQQQAILEAGATPNEYWAVSSAVLSATPDSAAMLLALQGQRGVEQDFKFITATLRADFDKSADGQWRVANLTVLKKPQFEAAGG